MPYQVSMMGWVGSRNFGLGFEKSDPRPTLARISYVDPEILVVEI